MIERLYKTWTGSRIALLLAKPAVTKHAYRYLDSPASRWLVRPFIRRNNIDMTEYPPRHWRSFNDFFTRSILPGKRPVDGGENVLISPCDGYAKALAITPGGELTIKGRPCTVEALLGNEALARVYYGGTCVVVRLSPANYHHYCFPTDGTQAENHYIPGSFHMVRARALARYPVYGINARTYTCLETRAFGDIVFMEVGAMLVGRICNRQGIHSFRRGQEKGYFSFGGSTVLMLFQADTVQLSDALLHISSAGGELPVKQGQGIGTAI